MQKIKPSLSKGTRDFLPQEVAKRNYIFDTIKSVFRKYGFEQIETPAIERLETLTGKYGDEGDKLLFKILNSGDYLAEVRNQKSEIRDLDPKEVTPLIAEKGLRYDLTVPLARYVVLHQFELAFPFKRFHIAPVWRADRPQKGRYQEFYQCDADVIGSKSLFCEVELTKIFLEVFKSLGVSVEVKINSRKILEGIASLFLMKKSEDTYSHEPSKEKADSFLVSLDKMDKIGYDAVVEELVRKGYDEVKFHHLKSILQQVSKAKTAKEQLSVFQNVLADNDFGSEFGTIRDGILELNSILSHFDNSDSIAFDLTLARGLTYYTGTIWEVKANGVQMGSIASGGRYDNLTEMFGGQNLSGVGISFGIERIYDVMEELNLFPAAIAQGVKVLFVPRDANVEEFTFSQVQTLRNAGIAAEIFLGNVKKQKHFTYAEQKGIPFMVEIGANEMESKQFRLRNVTERKEEGNGWTIEQLEKKFI